MAEEKTQTEKTIELVSLAMTCGLTIGGGIWSVHT